MANMIARLGVLLGLDSAEFNKGIADASRKLDQFAKDAVSYGAVAATALTAASFAALKYADELADVAAANDIAISTVLKLSNALENSGGKAEDAGKMLAGFTKFIDTAAKGSFEAQKSLAKIGISLKDVGNLSTEELFNKTVKNIAAIEDPLTRSARAMEILGKSAKGADFVNIADEMQNVTAITAEQADAIKNAAEMHDLFAAGARKTMLTLATELGPVLKTTIDYINEMSGKTDFLGSVFKTVFQNIGLLAANATYFIKGMLSIEWDAEKESAKLAAVKQKILNPDGGMGAFDIGSGQGWDAIQNGRETELGKNPEAEKAKRELEKAIKHQFELMKKGRMEELKVIEETNKALGDQYDIYRKGYMSENLRQDLTNRQLDRQQEIFDLTLRGQNMRGEDVQLAQDLLQIEYKRLDNIEAINKNETLTREAREQSLQKENDLAEKAIDLAKKRNTATRATREGSFGEGMEKGMGKFFRELPTELENGQRAFETVVGNMDTALTNFARSGKLSFKDLARSIIQDLIAIQLRASASNLFGMLFSSIVGGGISGPSSSASTWGDTQGFADGGDPPVGKISMVGERGPELFIPKTAGTIIPNHSLSGMGGTTNVTNNYINAIDTKSFEDRLLGSSTAIWAANQYGAKSLATTYGRT